MDTQESRTGIVMEFVKLSECGRPAVMDWRTYSAGADFLDRVASDLGEAMAEGQIVIGQEVGESGQYRDTVIREIVSRAIPSWTHEKWIAFVDLRAYQEVVEREGVMDMDDRADTALEQIAYRAVRLYLTNKDKEMGA
ncbi:hypothetical protein ACFY1P_07995 [Streptomyces sp. NPDC001407]|uniref:hypothetical protein n=1 Tax=Streptomyces sp. NPDC001407 TaxID=3364573 RepID=UPI0036AE125D